MQQLESLGISRLTKTKIELLKTFGKIKKVKDEGFFVDVDLVLTDDGLETYNNIPTLRSRYYNYPIREGDLVMLLTVDHLQNDFFEKGEFGEFPATYNSYVAIPVSTLNQFLKGSDKQGSQQGGGNSQSSDVIDFTNFFHVRTPKLNFQASINEDKFLIKADKVDYESTYKNFTETIKEKETHNVEGDAEFNYKKTFKDTVEGEATLIFKANSSYTYESTLKFNVKGNWEIAADSNVQFRVSNFFEVNSSGGLSLQASQPISIRTGESLGSLIAEGFNLIASSTTGPIPQAPSGISTGPTMASGSALSAVASRILKVCS